MSRSRRPNQTTARTQMTRVALGASALLVGVQLASVSPAGAASPPAVAATSVDLGTAAAYSVLAGSGVSNTGAATVLALDLGLSPTGAIAGFPPGTARAIHDKDTAAETAQADRQEAYDAVVAQTGGTAFAGDQAGATFTPGLYTSAAAVTNTGTMTLDADGDASAIFVFQIGAAMSASAASKVILTDGALAHNVYWQVLGAISFGAGARYVGTILTPAAVALGEGASLKGRILTSSTVALANSPVTQPIDDLTAPQVTLDGGAFRSTNDTTPMITGTSDEPAGRAVQVSVGGQTLRSAVGTAGAWAVSATTLSPGSHEVSVAVTDPSQNTGTASQVLTIDVAAPVIAYDGGASRATSDTTPTISGTTDESGAAVTVTVGQQVLTTTSTGTTWRVDAEALTETSHLVVASASDAAGNTGSESQVLTIDLTVPVLTIDGGPTRSTDDTSPWTYGTTAEKAGTTVHVEIGGQALTATVLPGGTWGVSAATLPPGTHIVVASVTDAAQNTGTATQSLAIGAPPGPVIPGPETPGPETPGPETPGPETPGPEVPGPPGQPGDPGGPGGWAHYRPDAAIRTPDGKFKGLGSYDGAAQKVMTRLQPSGRSATFLVRVVNEGDAPDQVKIRGASKNRRFTVTYVVSGRDVTKKVVSGRYRTRPLQSGGATVLVVTITRAKAADTGDKCSIKVSASSSHTPGTRDTVAAVVRIAG